MKPAFALRGLFCLVFALASGLARADAFPSVLGEWKGTYYTDGLTHAPGFGAWGGPPKTYSVTLSIYYQSDYGNYPYAAVSTIAGDMSEIEDGYYVGLIPVSGFVSGEGVVKLAFFSPQIDSQQVFLGHLTLYTGTRQISGSWTITQVSSGLEFTQYGTLAVKQRGYFCIPCVVRIAGGAGQDRPEIGRRLPARGAGIPILPDLVFSRPARDGASGESMFDDQASAALGLRRRPAGGRGP